MAFFGENLCNFEVALQNYIKTPENPNLFAVLV